jgi:hypothetical protein
MAFFDQVTATIPQTKEATGLGLTSIYGAISRGDIEVIAIGGRRLVVVESIKKLIERKVAEVQPDLRRCDTLPIRYPAKGLLAAAGQPAEVAPVKRGRGRPRKHPLPLDAG